MSQADFGDAISLSREMVGLIERGEKNITPSTVAKIKVLLTEKENKVINEGISPNVTKAPEGKIKRRIKGDSDKIEFYDVDFEAGTGVEFYDDIRGGHPEHIMDVPDFRGCTAFRSYGKSMEKLIDSGAILFGTKEEDWREYIEYGQIYGIVCHGGRRFLKYVRKSKAEKSHIMLVSENKEFDEFDLPRSKIKSMWLIHGWLNKRT
jgi:hypothetical protein